MTPTPETVEAYRASLVKANLPAARIEPRVVGFQAGYVEGSTRTGQLEPTPQDVELYRRGLAEIRGNGYQYCSSAALGYRDGWAAAVAQ